MLYVFSIYCKRVFKADFQYEILRHDEEERNSVECNAFFFSAYAELFLHFLTTPHSTFIHTPYTVSDR